MLMLCVAELLAADVGITRFLTFWVCRLDVLVLDREVLEDTETDDVDEYGV